MQHYIFIAINSIYCNDLYIATIYFENLVVIGYFFILKKGNRFMQHWIFVAINSIYYNDLL